MCCIVLHSHLIFVYISLPDLCNCHLIHAGLSCANLRRFGYINSCNSLSSKTLLAQKIIRLTTNRCGVQSFVRQNQVFLIIHIAILKRESEIEGNEMKEKMERKKERKKKKKRETRKLMKLE